jgi:hypothetical protein
LRNGRPLVEALVDAFLVLESAAPDEVNPDTAVRGMENMTSILLTLEEADQLALRTELEEIAGDLHDEVYRDFVARLPDVIGLTSRGTDVAAANDLERDIRRSVILSAYMRAWGLPSERVVSRRGPDQVEVYLFPERSDPLLSRFASVGVSGLEREDGTRASWELMMVLPLGLVGASAKEVSDFLLDVMAYSLRRDVVFEIGLTIPETPLMPKNWKPRALLLDEPRGEPVELDHFHVGPQRVGLVWLVPIYQDERELVLNQGLDAFDEVEQRSEWSPADPGRPSFVGGGRTPRTDPAAVPAKAR